MNSLARIDDSMSDRKPKILIVDDLPSNVAVLEIILKRQGMATASARNAMDIEKLVEREQPDLILLDIMMPGKSGFDACSDLKRNELTRDIPIIFLSAKDDVGSKVNGLSIGEVDYITKPFQKEEMLARIHLHLQLRSSHLAAVHEQKSRLHQVRKAQQNMLIDPSDLPRA